MEWIKGFYADVLYKMELNKWFKWLVYGSLGILVLGIVLIVFGSVLTVFDGGNESTAEKGTVQEEVSMADGDESSTQEVLGVSQETIHILNNPDQYTEEEVNSAYHDSLTTFDNQFVEDNVYKDTGLPNGVYLYHEKANDEYAEIAKLAQEIHELGVPVYFYTPQFDQSIASLSNHTPIIEQGEVAVKAVIVREYKVAEEMKDVAEVTEYMERIIDENKE